MNLLFPFFPCYIYSLSAMYNSILRVTFPGHHHNELHFLLSAVTNSGWTALEQELSTMVPQPLTERLCFRLAASPAQSSRCWTTPARPGWTGHTSSWNPHSTNAGLELHMSWTRLFILTLWVFYTQFPVFKEVWGLHFQCAPVVRWYPKGKWRSWS